MGVIKHGEPVVHLPHSQPGCVESLAGAVRYWLVTIGKALLLVAIGFVLGYCYALGG